MERNLQSIRWVTFLALIAVAAAFLYPFVDWPSTGVFIVACLVLVAAALLTWALELWLRFMLERFDRKDAISNENSSAGKRESERLVVAARRLLSAPTQRDTIRITMQEGMGILNAKGASFVGFDEWNVPIAPLAFGDVPLGADSPKFAAPELRQACKNCALRQSQGNCLLCKEMDGRNTAVIYCLPLMASHREVGVINFYLSSMSSVNASRVAELGELANAALTNLHRRDREMLAVRDLQPSFPLTAWNDQLVALCDILSALLGSEDVVLGLEFEMRRIDSVLQVFRKGDSDSSRLPPADAFMRAWPFIVAGDDLYRATFGFNDSACITQLRTGRGDVFGFIAWLEKDSGQETPPTEFILRLAEKLLFLAWETERSLTRVEYNAIGNERIRLAREVHDSLAQTLAFLKLQTSQMLAYANSEDIAKLESMLAANYRTLSDAYQSVRFEIDNLRSLPDGDLQNWLISEAATFTSNTAIPVDASDLHVHGELGLMAQSQLIRVVQEALNNIRKHAQASKVSLAGSDRGGEVVIEIADDGIGFEPSETQIAGKYGVVGMRERIELVGGEFQIISRPGNGTTIRLTLPVCEPAKKSDERSSR